MRIDITKAESFHCPRWNELPVIPLYMDQVVLVIEESIGIFATDEKIITSTMVNNYVKSGLIQPPDKKRYERRQVSALIVISIMKQVLSINEIMLLKRAIVDTQGREAAYDMFCDKLEEALRSTFGEAHTLNFTDTLKEEPISTLDASLVALMGRLYVQNFVKQLANANKAKTDT